MCFGLGLQLSLLALNSSKSWIGIVDLRKCAIYIVTCPYDVEPLLWSYIWIEINEKNKAKSVRIKIGSSTCKRVRIPTGSGMVLLKEVMLDVGIMA